MFMARQDKRAKAANGFPSRSAYAYLICVCVVLSTAVMAQRSERAFSASGRSCSDITWQPEVLTRYPNIGAACQEVVQYDGRDFVRFTGKVESVTRNGDTMTVRFDGADESISLDPPDNMRVVIAGRSTPVRDLARGQELTFHVPADQFVAQFFEPGSQTQFVAVSIIPLAVAQQGAQQVAAENQPRTLPQTASQLPLIGILGLALSMLGGLLLSALRSKHLPQRPAAGGSRSRLQARMGLR